MAAAFYTISIYDKLSLSYHDPACDAIDAFAFSWCILLLDTGVPFDIVDNFDVMPF